LVSSEKEFKEFKAKQSEIHPENGREDRLKNEWLPQGS
jgi:hypothetical protein